MMNSQLRFDVLSLFPQTVEAFTQESIVGKAIDRGLIDVQSRDLRDWSKGKHREADDRPFGGGAGMVLKPEPLFDAIEELSTPQTTVVYMAPDGEKFTTELAKEFSQNQHLVLVSGHYEGIDQRVRDQLVDREVSIGDYVLTNGALAASVLIDAVARHVPRGFKVPEVLLSGNHKAIARWRHEQRLDKTRRLRPDLETITQ